MSKDARLYNEHLDDAQQLIGMALSKISKAAGILNEDFESYIKNRQKDADTIANDLSLISERIDELPFLEQG